jgi:predicted N-acyltransferase
MHIEQINSLSQVSPSEWNNLAGINYPFLRHEFLLALEESGAVCQKTGWIPSHLLVLDNNNLVAFMPLYLKEHSWGEFVFDHQLAKAYQQYELNYYPKWLTAIPLTPCQGTRIIFNNSIDPFIVTHLLFSFITNQSYQHNISSWHCLFPALTQLPLFNSLQLTIREGVQFQWINKSYQNFDDFLQTLTTSKRKMIKRERRRVTEQGISFKRISGLDVSTLQWRIFYDFYSMTYLKKGSQPYLNQAFFQQIARTMGKQILLVLAYKNDIPIAAALSFIGKDTLYGRYWGCYDEHHSLHFETCYYQGLDYCIEHRLQRFDSGAQGEHKISRGFEPITTYSAHWIKDMNFTKAFQHFVTEEKIAVHHYKQNAISYLPFKKEL